MTHITQATKFLSYIPALQEFASPFPPLGDRPLLEVPILREALSPATFQSTPLNKAYWVLLPSCGPFSLITPKILESSPLPLPFPYIDDGEDWI